MRQYHILLGLLAALALGLLAITCSEATKPSDEMRTIYRRDYDYLDRTFFWLFWPEDSIAEIIDARIYICLPRPAVPDPDLILHDAQVAVDPDHFGQFPGEDRSAAVKELSSDAYNICNDNLYLEMMSYDRGLLIAGWFKVETTSGDTIQVGNIDDDTLMLKLISLDQNESGPDNQTFRNEWRNVYSIGMRDVDPRKLQIQIRIGAPGTETTQGINPDGQDGIKYITLLGIDRTGEHNSHSPDGKADLSDSAIFWPDKGYLFFPEMRPFDPGSTYNDIPLDITVPDVYDKRRSTIDGNPTEYTKYYLEFKYRE